MLIDSLAIQLSGAVKMDNTPGLVAQDKVIDALNILLTSVGWGSTGRFASGTVRYPFGFPSVSGIQISFPKRVAGCWAQPFLSLDGNTYTPYDPYNEVPDPFGQCIFFALDTSGMVGLANLASVIHGRYTAGAITSPEFQLSVTARNAGPDFNFPVFESDGRWGIHSEISGGGYDLTSVANHDGSGQLRTGQYTVRVTSHDSINPVTSRITHPIWFDFFTPSNGFGTIQVPIDSTRSDLSYNYVIVGNPYSFAIFCPDQITLTTAMFACAPYIPTEENFTPAYALFFVSPSLNGTWWDGGYGVSLDSPLNRAIFSGTLGFPRMLALRSPGATPLNTPSGTPTVTNAWVMFGRSTTSVPYVVGRLWDCAITNDVVPTLGTVIAGSRYIRLASQDGSAGQTRSSLLFRIT